MKRVLNLVKTHDKKPPRATLRRNFSLHLQGYELGLLVAGMVSTFALLALPRATEPETLPLPRIDRSLARRRDRQEEALAVRAHEGLPFEVRAVGESIRRLGRTSAANLDTGHDREDIAARVKTVLDAGQAELLLRLRAVQTQYFLAALDRFERTGDVTVDLTELGGDFLARARLSGWLAADRRCLADAATRRVLFELHWSDLIGKRRLFPFSPTLDDWRVYYRFLLLYPERLGPRSGKDVDDEARLGVVGALSRQDPDYPESFAKGYLLHRLGAREASAAAFRAQLAKEESGPYTLLARNHLLHALQGLSTE